MKHENREITGMAKCLFMLLVAFFIQLAVEIIGLATSVAAVVLHENRQLSYKETYGLVTKLMEENTPVMLLSVMAASICALVFGCWYYFGFVKKGTEEERGRIHVGSLPLLVLLGIGMQLFWSMLLTMAEQWQPGWFEAYNELMGSLEILGSLPALAYVAIVGPVSEELIFRGAILGNARKYMPFFWANILQAFLFGIYHMNLVQGIYAFCIGLVFGYIRVACKSVFASVALHISFNVFSIILAYQAGEELELSFGTEIAILFGGMVLAILALLPFIIKDRREKKKENDDLHIDGGK